MSGRRKRKTSGPDNQPARSAPTNVRRSDRQGKGQGGLERLAGLEGKVTAKARQQKQTFMPVEPETSVSNSGHTCQ